MIDWDKYFKSVGLTWQNITKTSCPGPTYQPGDTPEDHEGCCLPERKY